MSEWQPIETAPKDGRKFLACWHGKNQKTGDQYKYEPECMAWDGDFYWVVDGGQPSVSPTHWMPLPEPPK